MNCPTAAQYDTGTRSEGASPSQMLSMRDFAVIDFPGSFAGLSRDSIGVLVLASRRTRVDAGRACHPLPHNGEPGRLLRPAFVTAVTASLVWCLRGNPPQRYSVTDLGTLGGGTSHGHGINASGRVAGEAATASGAFHAFRYANRMMRDLNSMIDPAMAVYVTLISGKGIHEATRAPARRTRTLLSKH
jgi:probable HAF family extracellular repeat protein